MRAFLRLLHLLLLAGCGPEAEPPRPAAPGIHGVAAWAHVSKEQIAEAARVEAPVAFENAICMRFVLIPAGTFTMGSPPPTEESRDETETAHEVTLSKPSYLGVTEVPNGQYRRFQPDHHSPSQDDAHPLDGDDQPVNEVSWDEAMAFVEWLNAQEPRNRYRLPTEAEWERACRAGTSTPFWWGTSIRTDQANYDGNSVYGGGVGGTFRRATVPVGSLPASPWGLHEIHGNVREWCADVYDDRDYPNGRATDPKGPAPGERNSRLVRGGAFAEASHMLRAAFRIGVGGGEARSYVGFRVAASVSET